MSTKFYVYGGGRWRELDLNTGRVSGWAKSARIVVARNGRLECPRTTPILRALRALAAGEPSRAREGPRLQHLRWPEKEPQTQKPIPYNPCQHCCHHRYTAVVENVCNHAPAETPVRPPQVQTQSHNSAVPSTQTLGTDQIFDRLRSECINQPEQISNSAQILSPAKRGKRSNSISKDPLHSAARRSKRQSVSSNSSIEFVSHISNGIDRQENGIPVKLETEENKVERRGRPSKQTPTKILDIVTSDVSVKKHNSKQRLRITSAKCKSASALKKKNVQPNSDIGRTERSPETGHNVEKNNVQKSNDDSQNTSHYSNSERTHDETVSSSDDEERQQTLEMNKLVAYKLHNGGVTAATARRVKPAARSMVCKEIVIDENDVSALRGFLRRSAPNVSLTRFDNDDAYKRGIFFHLHPLVNLDRCSRIQQMLSERDDISLRDFASQLGLRSISDDVPPRRGTPNGSITRSSRERKQPDRYAEVLPQATKSPVNKLLASTKSTTKSLMSLKRRNDKKAGSSSASLKKTAHTNAKSLSQSPSPIKSVARQNDSRKSSSTPKKVSGEYALAKLFGSSDPIPHKNLTLKSSTLAETAREVSNSSDQTKKTAGENGLSERVECLNNEESTPKSRALPQPVVSLSRDQPRRNAKAHQPAPERRFKEYSSMEDDAILSWVSKEDRARRVNGNCVWRELQDQYQHLTGIGRTWQSLRNRYLRNILPSLSSLAVSPSRAARLRAAAATGEIKSKRRPPRRNSIFATQGVSGAWSRRPRLNPKPQTASPTPTAGDISSSPSATPPRPTAPAQDKVDTGPSSQKRIKRRKRSRSESSTSSSSGASDTSVRLPQLRYSEVTRRFARRQQVRYSSESSGSRPPTTDTAHTSTRTRRLFNPKAAL